MYRIAVVEDAADLRALLTYVLDRNPAFEVCGEGASGLAAIQLAEEFEPDVMLLDVTMPGMSGIDALKLILARSPKTQVFMLSGHAPGLFAREATGLGASGVLEKDGGMQHLPERLLALLDPAAVH